MSANSSIEWTDRTWNPVRGCSIVSPGCVNCYAMKQAHRFSGKGKPYEGLTKPTSAGPQWTGRIRLVDEALIEPLRWKKPCRVFVNSMSDLFHEDVPFDFVDRVVATMAQTKHTYQILTKRPERMLAYSDGLANLGPNERSLRLARSMYADHPAGRAVLGNLKIENCGELAWPLPNVWLGVSAENQQQADNRIPLLLQTPAAMRFVSYEPAIGPVNFKPEWLGAVECCPRCEQPKFPVRARAGSETTIGWPGCVNPHCDNHGEQSASATYRRMLDWIIVGGESGDGAREFNIGWARTVIQQTRESGVACFVKQIGSKPFYVGTCWFDPNGPEPIRPIIDDKKGGDMGEWAAHPSLGDICIREYPAVRS